MQLNQLQIQALEMMNEWLETRSSHYFILQGFAGTGKTTILKTLLEQSPIAKNFALVAPTGKAAKVLSSKTGLPATTIHKMLYKPVEDKISQLQKLLSEALTAHGDLEPPHPEVQRILDAIDALTGKRDPQFIVKHNFPYRGLIIDEYSMVQERVARDLMDLEIPMILVGDPFQLPPVRARNYWEEDEPNIILTEIMRQTGEGSGIILASRDIRTGRPFSNGEGFRRIRKGILPIEEYSKADIILCGTHKTRQPMNRQIRSFLGFKGDTPEVGEKLICLNNNARWGISNGEIFFVKEIVKESPKILVLHLEDEDGKKVSNVMCWKPLFTNDRNTDDVPFGYGQFTYAYAITVHKSQGSEWNNTIVIDDYWLTRDQSYPRWLYTGVTRAKSSCILIN